MKQTLFTQNNSELQIKYGAIMSYLTIVFNIVTGLLYTPWMIQEIGQSNYGLYSLAMTLISFFTIDFGLGEAVSRFLAKYNSENEQDKKRDFLGITFKIYLFIDILIFFVFLFLLIFADKVYSELTTAELIKFRVVFSVTALYSIASFPFTPLNGVLISSERFIFLKFVDLLNKVLTVGVMVIVLLFGYKLYSLVIVNAVVGLVAVFLKLQYIKSNKLMEINIHCRNKSLLREVFNFSIWVAVINLSARFIINISPSILAMFAGTVQISIFSIAMVIEGYTWTISNALNGLFLTKVTRMNVHKTDSEAIENLMIKIGRIQLIIIGLLVIGFLTMGKEFMILWMGQEYLESYYVTLLLITPCIITLTQDIGNTALLVVNKVKYRAYCYLITAFVSFVLSVLLSPYFGAVGTGVSILFGNIVGIVIGMNIVYQKVLKIDILRFFKECHFKMLIYLMVFSAIGFWVQYMFPVTNLFLFLIKVAIIGVVYFGLMWLKVLNEDEKNLIKSMFIRVRRS